MRGIPDVGCPMVAVVLLFQSDTWIIFFKTQWTQSCRRGISGNLLNNVAFWVLDILAFSRFCNLFFRKLFYHMDGRATLVSGYLLSTLEK